MPKMLETVALGGRVGLTMMSPLEVWPWQGMDMSGILSFPYLKVGNGKTAQIQIMLRMPGTGYVLSE